MNSYCKHCDRKFDFDDYSKFVLIGVTAPFQCRTCNRFNEVGNPTNAPKTKLVFWMVFGIIYVSSLLLLILLLRETQTNPEFYVKYENSYIGQLYSLTRESKFVDISFILGMASLLLFPVYFVSLFGLNSIRWLRSLK